MTSLETTETVLLQNKLASLYAQLKQLEKNEKRASNKSAKKEKTPHSVADTDHFVLRTLASILKTLQRSIQQCQLAIAHGPELQNGPHRFPDDCNSKGRLPFNIAPSRWNAHTVQHCAQAHHVLSHLLAFIQTGLLHAGQDNATCDPCALFDALAQFLPPNADALVSQIIATRAQRSALSKKRRCRP